jgi:hypothetical protein
LAFPAGILIPEGAGYRSLQAGFGQIEAQIMKVGMAKSPACPSHLLSFRWWSQVCRTTLPLASFAAVSS